MNNKFFLRSFIIQEMLTYVILVPVVVFLHLELFGMLRSHIFEITLLVMIQAVPSACMGAFAKYRLVTPAARVMENDSSNAEDISHAIRCASIAPLCEAITAFVRWAVLASLSVPLVIYAKKMATFDVFAWSVNIISLAGLSAMCLYYLMSENSLAPFFEWCSRKGVSWKNERMVKISITRKLLAAILLIVIPPVGNLLGVISYSIHTGTPLTTVRFGLFVLVVQTLITTFLNGLLFVKGLKQSVSRMSFMLEDIAEGQGNLTKRLEVKGSDEVGELAFCFNKFMKGLEGMIGRMKNVSVDIHAIIEDVSAGSQALSQTTLEQAASVKEVSASIEEMDASVKNNAEQVREGQEASHEVTKLIDQSKEVFAALRKSIEEVSQDSKRIGDIVSTVNDVAFHTNLLALNAAVEAARAGEQGKGFAVVAGEVRSLAQRSAEAAREIKVLIEGTVSRINNSDEMVKKTSSTLEDLVSRMEKFFKVMEVVSTSSMEQNQSIGELNRAITQISEATQSNSATAEEIARALENLRSIAAMLAGDMQKFKTTDDQELHGKTGEKRRQE